MQMQMQMKMKMQISDFLVDKYKHLFCLNKLKSFLKNFIYFFADSREKSFRVGTFQQGLLGNRKHTYFFLANQYVKSITIGSSKDRMICLFFPTNIHFRFLP